jgi:archaemetzincin
MKYIYIQPIGNVGNGLLDHLAAQLEAFYGYPCRVASSICIPEFSFNHGRGQYNAEILVTELSDRMAVDAMKLLGVVDADLFVPGLNFVFGLAAGNISVISIARLKPLHSGEKENKILFWERVLKEAIHELGHTFGLHHCPDIRCVMHFSNNLEDTDIKSSGFCRVCSIEIRTG